MTTDNTLLVLGGTGKTGRRVVERLARRNAPVRVGSRSGTPPFDWENQATWAPVLQDVGAVYITYQPDLGAPGAVEAISAFTEVAAASGVRRAVLLSGRNGGEAQRSEQVFQDSGLEWTIVRASWFDQNFSEDFLLEPVLGGVVALPIDGVKEPFIDADDIADVVVAALTEEGHAGQVYELTGPRLLTFAEAVSEIAGASGRDVRFVPLSLEQYNAGLQAAQVPDTVVRLLNYLFTTVLDGRNAYLTEDVERVLGRKPREFADYARATAATGVWTA
jgi:uncharacterized protein YbjT (DUF2867 family)